MPQTPDWKQFLDAGVQFVTVRRAEARRRARALVATGQLAQEQVQAFVDALVDESRRRTDELLDLVRKEIRRQVGQLGLVTRDDLARLEVRLRQEFAASRAATKGAKATTAGAKGAKAGKRAGAKAAKAGKTTGAKRTGGNAAEPVAPAAVAG